MNAEALAATLMQEEGVRWKPYQDSRGIWTIGCGRNLQSKGLSSAEVIAVLTMSGISPEAANFLLQNDLKDTLRFLDATLPWWRALSEERQQVLADMTFNLGNSGILGFQRMLAALKSGSFEAAADEMVASEWYTQVGTRGPALVARMRKG